MRYLADTHIALWLIAEPDLLPAKAKAMMENPGNDWFLSLASVWEVALKHAKRPDSLPMTAKEFHGDCIESGLPVEGVHGDPFDRILLAQAECEDLLLVTHDAAFDAYHNEYVVLV